MRSRTPGLGLLVAATTAAALVAAAPPSQAGGTATALAAGSYTVDTTALTFTGPSTSLGGTVVDGVAVFAFTDLVVPQTATITVTGDRPVEIKAAGTLTLAGAVIADGGDATTDDATPGPTGPSGGAGGHGDSGAGMSEGVGAGGGGAASGSSSGGGGGGFGGVGAAGGKSNADAHAGGGGGAYGNLNAALMGGSGGGGASDVAGGGGGGAVALVARSLTITSTGLVRADGGDGAGGSEAASGGGSGGGILLHATSLTLKGVLRADGGDGGGGGCCGDGGGGGGGRIALQYGSYVASPVALSVAGGTSGAVDYASGVASPQATGGSGVVTYRTIAATSLSIGRSTSVHRGRPVAVRTRLTATSSGKAVARQTVVLYQRPSRTTRWHRVATRTTSRKGTAVVHLTAKRSKQYRWRYAGDWMHVASVSHVQRVHVRR